ncbi:MAG: HEAT repeat domain-containing protein [Sedimentisphaerales bacterium]|nr:HEAT repeat domain-containing protein [Sedimentisphaerales bacterium]
MNNSIAQTKGRRRFARQALVLLMVLIAALVGSSGCNSPTNTFSSISPSQLNQRIRAVTNAAVVSSDPITRCHGLESLAALNDLQAAATIHRHFYDNSAAVRFAAAMAAGDMRDTTARPQLQILLRDNSISVQLAAAYALERIGDQRFGNWYDHVLASDNAQLCGQACMILGRLGNNGIRQDSRDKLWRVLNRPDQDTAVRLQAAEALARLGDERIIERLLAYGGSTYADDRLMAISGLELLGGADAFAMLTVLAGDPQIEVRLAAFGALGSANDQTNLQELRDALEYRDPDGDQVVTERVRGLALLSLGKIANPQDGNLLYHTMEDNSEYLRLAAARAAIDWLRNQNQIISATGM